MKSLKFWSGGGEDGRFSICFISMRRAGLIGATLYFRKLDCECGIWKPTALSAQRCRAEPPLLLSARQSWKFVTACQSFHQIPAGIDGPRLKLSFPYFKSLCKSVEIRNDGSGLYLVGCALLQTVRNKDVVTLRLPSASERLN